MAGNAESRPARRLSVRAATEPLPTPLPPPPRPGRSGAPLDGESGSNRAPVPPQPHFVTRFPVIDPSQLEPTTARKPESNQPSQPQRGLPQQSVPDRSLASPGVIISLAASIAVLCAIGWYEKHGIDSFKWDGIKTFVHGGSIDPVDSDEELPFITAVPLTPQPAGVSSIAKDAEPAAKEADQVVLSDARKGKATGTSNEGRTQRR